ncbi:protein TILLER ANGLE CONTROL 1 [Diospyros lotus]|uniref:protein TILLER ANGLE CONTROL 1 n=1 Tax=Diospyros lotus TaxID=55363 RepID=UPI002253DA3F|nr:protein TILLER ANGLE CONTROL 1 [Diospyros lotus]
MQGYALRPHFPVLRVFLLAFHSPVPPSSTFSTWFLVSTLLHYSCSTPTQLLHSVSQSVVPLNSSRMKIFNWVHRKFHHKEEKSKAELVNTEADTQVLLESVTLANVLDDWSDGILTIGTFGLDPVSVFSKINVSSVFGKEEECCDELEEYGADKGDESDEENEMEGWDKEEVHPLVFAALDDEGGNGLNYDEKADFIMAGAGDGSVIPLPLEIGLDANEDKETKKRERTTLADLFSADSEIVKKRDRSKLHLDSKRKADDLHPKKGLSFAKKLISRVGEDAHPVKKLQRMIRRMMKRKIHPDFEGELQIKEKESQIKPIAKCGLPAGGHRANESVSLLQTKDAMVV